MNKTFKCKHCGFTDEYEHDEECGISYYQTNKGCPVCGEPTGLQENIVISITEG